MSKNLLVELFVEELPPKTLKKLGDVFARVIRQCLIDDLLVGPEEKWEWFASPRRLAVRIENVESQQAVRIVQEKLLPVSVALDATGKPTQALLKKLKSKSLNESIIPDLVRRMDGKIETLFSPPLEQFGFALHQLLGDALEQAIAKLPIPKVMTYQLADGWTTVKFVRPAHCLVILHGDEVLDGVRTHTNELILGLKPGRETRGHRFEADVNPIVLKDADSYVQQLEIEGAVIANFAARREEIVRQLKAAAATAGGTPIEDDALLDEVTALVERPNVLIGQFEEAFLEVPQECLILTMKANQKYFPLLDSSGKLTNKFLIVSNIRPADPTAVIEGNERVVRPRLADAKFFFDQDRKKKLEDRVAGLAKVIYHNKLGTQGERTQRVRTIARALAEQIGVNAEQADAAAHLAKADLLTDMVGEFPELQGTMGRYYALHDGLPSEIADAIEDHYKPRFSGDSLPRGKVGAVVALADKLETLFGLFLIGQVPTGEKDPYALRRYAIGVIRILSSLETDKTLTDFFMLVKNAFHGFPVDERVRAVQNVVIFIFERMSGLLQDEGYLPSEVAAVLALNKPHIMKRLAAVRAFATMPEAAALAAVNKRVGNILKKVEGTVFPGIDKQLLVERGEQAEQALASTLTYVIGQADLAFERGDYTAALQALAKLKVPVDKFFTEVMVNTEDPALRANRLGLLAQLYEAMNRIADISKLAT